jgi:hypothetical protein
MCDLPRSDQIKSPFCIFEPQYQTNPNYVCTSSEDKNKPQFCIGSKNVEKKMQEGSSQSGRILQLLRAHSQIFCLTTGCQISKVWFKGLGVEAYLLLLVCILIMSFGLDLPLLQVLRPFFQQEL